MALERVHSSLATVIKHLPWRRGGSNERVEVPQPTIIQDGQPSSGTKEALVAGKPPTLNYKALAQEYFRELLGMALRNNEPVSIEQLKSQLSLCGILAGVDVPKVLDSIPSELPFGHSLIDSLPELLSDSMTDPLPRNARRKLQQWHFRRSLEVKTQDASPPKTKGLPAIEPDSATADKTIPDSIPTINPRTVVYQTLNTDTLVEDDSELEKLIRDSKCAATPDMLSKVVASLRTKELKELMNRHNKPVKYGPFKGYLEARIGRAGRLLFHIDPSSDILYIRIAPHREIYGTKLRPNDTARSL